MLWVLSQGPWFGELFVAGALEWPVWQQPLGMGCPGIHSLDTFAEMSAIAAPNQGKTEGGHRPGFLKVRKGLAAPLCR